MHVLFIGNSITYSNNLPEVFESISQGKMQADMFVRPGSTLSELIKDPRLGRLLASGRYQAVVVQEKGGNVFCMHSAQERLSADCQEMQSAHIELARVSQLAGAMVVYLGTYQSLPAASQALVAIEKDLSHMMNSRYAQVSERLRSLRQDEPALPWLQDDGAHPGIATTALMATAVYVSATGRSPPAEDLCIRPSLFRPYGEVAVLALHHSPSSDSQPECLLDSVVMGALIAATRPEAKAAGSEDQENE